MNTVTLLLSCFGNYVAAKYYRDFGCYQYETTATVRLVMMTAVAAHDNNSDTCFMTGRDIEKAIWQCIIASSLSSMESRLAPTS